ncbi:hypothetical protein [Saccharopolyspora antimicrobica]|nr:hypothetical protein [Saccharopolyspora antimicrobica]
MARKAKIGPVRWRRGPLGATTWTLRLGPWSWTRRRRSSRGFRKFRLRRSS